MPRTVSLVMDSYPAIAGLDTTLARALLRQVSSGELPETFRLYTPGRIVAFGKRDTLERGFLDAARAAADLRYVPLIRLAGGRAAIFNEHTLAFGWATPAADPRRSVQDRFQLMSDMLMRAFRRLGVDTAIGEIPGEYCPGRFSVHHSGRRKVMGVGQRLAANAAHVGGVIVVSRPDLINDIIHPVYAGLDVDFDPDATGALSDVVPGVTTSDVAAAIVAELETSVTLTPATISSRLLAEGRAMLPDHLVTVDG